MLWFSVMALMLFQCTLQTLHVKDEVSIANGCKCVFLSSLKLALFYNSPAHISLCKAENARCPFTLFQFLRLCSFLYVCVGGGSVINQTRLLEIHVGLVSERWMLYFPTPPERSRDMICLAANGCGAFFKRANQRHLRLGQAIESNDPP